VTEHVVNVVHKVNVRQVAAVSAAEHRRSALAARRLTQVLIVAIRATL
jgi:hypothetical protein